MTKEISVAAEGETVGEAKWAALRELGRLVPGVDRESVRFDVISEGERGILGVGFSPAKVSASTAAPAPIAVSSASASSAAPPESDSAVVRELLERVVATIGEPATVTVDESEDEIVATISGDHLGFVIGRHGQTVDALQYLANAILRGTHGGEHRHVTVDAAGYRARRAATVEALVRQSAEQVAATGRRVALEPMTAVERKLVHESLKDDPEVETTSEGTEPNRYVVILQRSTNME